MTRAPHGGRFALAVTIVAITAVATVGETTRAQETWTTYRDAAGRFTFEYPSAFGAPGPGTNDGFGDRVASIRFANLTGLGGEAALVRGAVMVDIQALGGLYDPLALEIFPDAVRAQVVAARPPVTHRSFCSLLAAADHLGAAPGLPDQIRAAARSVDRMRNIDPRVVTCQMAGDTITFHKEATFTSGAATARQHLYGAIRFLEGRYSAFQIVRGGLAPPSDADLSTLGRLVRSLTIGT